MSSPVRPEPDFRTRLRKRLGFPVPSTPQMTLGPVETRGYYASPDLAQQVDPIQARLRAAMRESNQPAMAQSREAMQEGTGFGPLAVHTFADNVAGLPYFLPGADDPKEQAALRLQRLLQRPGEENLSGVQSAALGMVGWPGVNHPNRALTPEEEQTAQRLRAIIADPNVRGAEDRTRAFIEAGGDVNAPFFPAPVNFAIKGMGFTPPTNASALGALGAGGAATGMYGVMAGTPGAGSPEAGMTLTQIGAQLLKAGAGDAAAGGALAYHAARQQGATPGEALREAGPEALRQAIFGMGVRGLHGLKPIGQAVSEAGPGLRSGVESLRDFFSPMEPLMGEQMGNPLQPIHEYQTLLDQGRPIPPELEAKIREQEARATAEGDVRGEVRSLLPDLANERGAVGVPERVTAATVRLSDGTVFSGTSHGDAYAKAVEAVGDEHSPLFDGMEDGYATTRRPHVTREEGIGIAQSARQIDEPVGADAFARDEDSRLKINRAMRGSTITDPQQFHDHFFGPSEAPNLPSESVLGLPKNNRGMLGTYGITSRLPKSIQAAKLEKAPAQTWVSKLRGAGNNASEFDWVVGEVLRRDPKRVWTRQQLLDLAEGKGIKLEERVLSDEATSNVRWHQNDSNRWMAVDGNNRNRGTYIDRLDNGKYLVRTPGLGMDRTFDTLAEAQAEGLARVERASVHGTAESPKFSSYQLPGGTNYREVVVRLEPQQVEGRPYHIVRDEDLIPAIEAALPDANPRVIEDDIRRYMQGQRDADAMRGAEAIRVLRDSGHGDILDAFAESFNTSDALRRNQLNEFQSQHWDDPNVLLHLRLNDRVGPNGEKVLFVEELQSDWMQRGRKEGFQGEPGNLTVVRDPANGRVSVDNLDTGRSVSFPIDQVQGLTDQQVIDHAVTTNRRQLSGGVPDAPGMFKDTPQWTLLGLKRALDEAVAGGYDRMAWTTGAQQAERYDLSKVVDEVQYDPDSRTLITFGEGGRQHFSDVPPEELADYIGKEGAERLLASPREGVGERWDVATQSWGGEGSHVLRGADLQVGGEGMHGYYDQIVPDALKGYAKKLGVRLDIEPTDLGASREEWLIHDNDPYEPNVVEEGFKTEAEAEEALARMVEEMGYESADDAGYMVGVRNEGQSGSTQQSIRITPELRSKIQGGQELGQGAPRILAGTAGGIGGAAYGATQGDTPEERARNALLYGAAGLAGGVGLGRFAENAPLARLFGGVEEAPYLRGGQVRELLPSLGNERGAVGRQNYREPLGKNLKVEPGRPRDVGEAAIQEFGETHSPEEAGYLLSDGRWVDFSEGSGSRITDHRSIERIFTGQDPVRDSRFANVQRMMDEGHARIHISNGSVNADISQPLTDTQVRQLRSAMMAHGRRNELSLDLTVDGEVVASVTRDNVGASELSDALNELYEKGGLR